jgi:hypothetical protein
VHGSKDETKLVVLRLLTVMLLMSLLNVLRVFGAILQSWGDVRDAAFSIVPFVLQQFVIRVERVSPFSCKYIGVFHGIIFSL